MKLARLLPQGNVSLMEMVIKLRIMKFGVPGIKRPRRIDKSTDLLMECSTAFPSLKNIRKIVKADPLAAQVTDEAGMLPLHNVCLRYPPIGVIQCLVKAYKDSVKRTDTFGRFALHCACMGRADLRVIQYLMVQYPDAVKIPECKGILPFHFACMGPTELEVIQYVKSLHPDAIKTDVRGLHALHFACANGALPEVIQYLAYVSNEALRIGTPADGMIPLHLLCVQRKPCTTSIIYLIHAWPESICVRNHAGKTPLEYILSCSRSS